MVVSIRGCMVERLQQREGIAARCHIEFKFEDLCCSIARRLACQVRHQRGADHRERNSLTVGRQRRLRAACRIDNRHVAGEQRVFAGPLSAFQFTRVRPEINFAPSSKTSPLMFEAIDGVESVTVTFSWLERASVSPSPSRTVTAEDRSRVRELGRRRSRCGAFRC